MELSSIRLLVLTVGILWASNGQSQTDRTLEESDLPILYFKSLNGEPIVNGFKRKCSFYLFDNGGTNRLTDSAADSLEEGFAFLNFRGTSSLMFPKRNINLEFNLERDDADIEKALLGMPKHEEWALHGPYSDKTLIRNAIAYNWGRKIQPWAPRIRYVNVVVNYEINGVATDSYEGIYLLTEEPHRDNDRVNISKLDQNDLDDDDITGGYVLEIGQESNVPANHYFFSDYAQNSSGNALTQYNISYPNPDSLATAQYDYISNYVSAIEDVMADRAMANDPATGYRNLIDLPSWIDHNIIQELTGNFDAYRRSSYILKDRDDKGGRFAAGPIWDFNIAFGNDSMCMGPNVTGWVSERNATCGKSLPKFIDWMFEDPMYKARFRARWEGLRQNILSDAQLETDIDSLLAIIDIDQVQDQRRWNQIGTFVWPNAFIGNSYDDEVNYLRSWITRRVAWIDANVQLWPTVESLQSNNTTLPILRIDVPAGDTIPTGRIDAWLRVINNGPDQLNSPTGAATGYNRNIAIELKGSADEKSNYSFETQDENGEDYPYRLLDLPKEEDWVLLGPYADKTMIREALGTKLAREAKGWAPRTEPVVLYINGEYRGVYVLTESVKRDDSRIDIANLKEDEISGDDLTGGYILEIDGDGNDIIKGFNGSTSNTYYQYNTPNDDDIVGAQRNYIQGVVNAFEQGLATGGYNAIAASIDGEQFAEFMLAQELAANSKAYRRSTYLYKDKDSNDARLRIEGASDFNRGFGNDVTCGGVDVTGWVVEESGRCGNQADVPSWFRQLWADSSFRSLVKQQWLSLRQDKWSDDELLRRIDQYALLVSPEADANFATYPILGVAVGRNDFVGNSYEEELNFLKQWTIDRARWIDGNLDILSSTSNSQHSSSFALLPNPAVGVNTVELQLDDSNFTAQLLTVRVIDPLGRMLSEQVIQRKALNTIAVGQLAEGTYIIEVSSATKTVSGRLILR